MKVYADHIRLMDRYRVWAMAAVKFHHLLIRSLKFKKKQKKLIDIYIGGRGAEGNQLTFILTTYYLTEDKIEEFDLTIEEHTGVPNLEIIPID